MYAVLNVMNMDTVVDCPHRIPPSGTPAHHNRLHPNIGITTAQHHASIPQIGTEAVGLNRNHITEDIKAKVTINPQSMLWVTLQRQQEISQE